MVLLETGRTFTLALRTVDGEPTSIPGEACFVTWKGIGPTVFPYDIPMKSKFRVKYSFQESVGIWEKEPTDNYGVMRRQKDVFCTLANGTYGTAEWGNEENPGFGIVGHIGTINIPRLDNPFVAAFPATQTDGQMDAPHTILPRYVSQCPPFLCHGVPSSISITYRDNTPDTGTESFEPCYFIDELDIDEFHNSHFKYSGGLPISGNANDAMPVFWGITQVEGMDPVLFDKGPPNGTHVFEFELLL